MIDQIILHNTYHGILPFTFPYGFCVMFIDKEWLADDIHVWYYICLADMVFLAASGTTRDFYGIVFLRMETAYINLRNNLCWE